ncbi:Polysaccharide pyruvyl transferase [Parapedobacter composti]|uniref:Polysaccharide pyruvyl transferase n=2 Tax=Parapedobacter composti TaxID=623281 RepID=A0A1I1GYX2_9SPHI|nr:Polysaccharide pyruvyl transferase [Parapedobacter composti]
MKSTDSLGMKAYNRRGWLRTAATAGIGAVISSALTTCTRGADGKVKTILVVSGWQDVNIGDIAHTPGLLNVLQVFLPDAKIILWKKSHSEAVKVLLETNFPDVKIIYGHVSKEGDVNSQEVIEAMDAADILIHGSGPSVVGKDNLRAWLNHTDKPFGIFGDTIAHIDPDLKSILDMAKFIFTRETRSLKVIEENRIAAKRVMFGPDATFYFNLTNGERAQRFLHDAGLEGHEFICVIPRLRYTPYYKIRPNNGGWSEEKIADVEAHNDKWKEVDHSKLREVMIAWVRDSGGKVLVCPEMTYQVDIMDELLIDPLPEDVKPNVLKRGYWLPDEAASIYSRAKAVFSFECHSPIIALHAGTPSFYLRQPEDTIKGQMYYDLGMDDWVFEMDGTDAWQLVSEARKVWNDYPAAKAAVASVMDRVNKLYGQCIKAIKQELYQ